jgi:hypothetical protein
MLVDEDKDKLQAYAVQLFARAFNAMNKLVHEALKN